MQEKSRGFLKESGLVVMTKTIVPKQFKENLIIQQSMLVYEPNHFLELKDKEIPDSAVGSLITTKRKQQSAPVTLS